MAFWESDDEVVLEVELEDELAELFRLSIIATEGMVIDNARMAHMITMIIVRALLWFFFSNAMPILRIDPCPRPRFRGNRLIHTDPVTTAVQSIPIPPRRRVEPSPAVVFVELASV